MVKQPSKPLTFMFLKRSFLLLLILVLFSECKKQDPAPNPLKVVLSSQNEKIKRVMDQLDVHEVQIRFTQIDRINDSVHFTDYDFQVEPTNYFYPASTVKFPIAVLTLEKLNETQNLDLYTRFYVEGDSIETTFANDISKIFAISDNEANNRLFEFLGQDAINKKLALKGISPLRFSHRLSVPDADNVTTKPLIVYLNDSTTTQLYPTTSQPIHPLKLNQIKKGSGYYEKDSLIRGAFDFSLKNYYPIDAQHGVLKRVIFPEKFKENERFNLTKAQRDFLLTAMHTLPGAVGYPIDEYYDSYGKFFLFGDSKERIPKTIKMYNKVGYAYGTLTDCAYIQDTATGVEFLLTATLLVNKDGIFNDSTYDYDQIGIPFLAELGRQLYALEVERKKG
jgi:hypothetical protein